MCKVITVQGNRCKIPSEDGSEKCWLHNKKYIDVTLSDNSFNYNDNGSDLKSFIDDGTIEDTDDTEDTEDTEDDVKMKSFKVIVESEMESEMELEVKPELIILKMREIWMSLAELKTNLNVIDREIISNMCNEIKLLVSEIN